GAEQRGDRVARSEVARHAGQKGHDQAEPEQVEKDREEQRAERGLLHLSPGDRFIALPGPIASGPARRRAKTNRSTFPFGPAITLSASPSRSKPASPISARTPAIAASRTAASRMTPLPRPAASRPASNCGFTRATS